MADDSILTVDDYPEPRPLYLKSRNRYVVCVSVPSKLKHLLGGQTDIRRTAGKTPEDYERVKRSKTNEIYALFDQVQEARTSLIQDLEDAEIKLRHFGEDLRAETCLWHMMARFPTTIPPNGKDILEPKDGSFVDWEKTDIPFQVLSDLKTNMDSMAQMVKSSYPTDEEGIAKAKKHFYDHNFIRDDGTGKMRVIGVTDSDYVENPDMRWKGSERLACAEYLRPVVHSYLEDLLTTTALRQNIEPPTFKEKDPSWFWDNYVETLMDIDQPINPRKLWHKHDERPRRNKAITFSSVRDEYLAWCEEYRPDVSQSSQNKWRQAIDEFILYMGDPELSKLHPAMPIEFAEAQIANHPNRSKRVIRDRNWGMSNFCKRFAEGRRLVSSNPFQGAGIGIYGIKGEHWLEYSDEDLDKIFDYPWEAQEKLLLEFALATGMRLNEIASLTWERVMPTNRYDYVTLKDRFDLPNQTVKNDGSKRDIPLHPSFRRPEKATGRIFDYKIDGYGYATTSAGRAVNGILNELVPDPLKSFHSFRSTFIIKLTESGCDTFTNRAIAGHGGRNANESVYNAVRNDTRFEAIEKLQLEPWLNRVPKDLLETKEN